MSAQLERLANAIREVSRAIAELEAAGQGIPAVEKNGKRLRGTLRALEVQFLDLAGHDDPQECSGTR